jgi:hypothetical protein
MDDFTIGDEYILIEIKNGIESIVYLGTFVKYIDCPWGSDWLIRAKAVFEKDTIHKPDYNKIIQYTKT